MRRWLTVGGLVAALILAGVLGSSRVGGPASRGHDPAAAASSGLANLWVLPTGSPAGTCTRSSEPETWSAAVQARRVCNSSGRPPGAFQAAYAAAADGDMVKVVNGPGGDDYGHQTIGPGDKHVTLVGAAGRPEIGRLVNSGRGTTVRGFTIEARGEPGDPGGCSPGFTGFNGQLVACAPEQTYDDLVVDGSLEASVSGTCPRVGVRGGGDGFVFKNSTVTGVEDAKGMEIGGRDMLIENNLFTGIAVTNTCYPDVHNECVFASTNLDGTVFRRNRFVACPTHALFVTACTAPSADCRKGVGSDVTIENNVFGHTTTASGTFHPGCALVIGSTSTTTYENWQIRYNTFETCWDIGAPPGSGGSAVVGNLGGHACRRGFRYRYNVGTTCGGTGDLSVEPAVNTARSPDAAPFYVDAPGGDLRLRAASPAIGRGDPADYPAVDKDGVTRRTPPDAGAYERGE